MLGNVRGIAEGFVIDLLRLSLPLAATKCADKLTTGRDQATEVERLCACARLADAPSAMGNDAQSECAAIVAELSDKRRQLDALFKAHRN